MRRVLNLLLVALLLFTRNVRAADSDNYRFDHIAPSSTWINAIFQDRDGFIWFGTRSGLYRYDERANHEARAFKGENIEQIHQDPEGRLWLYKRNGFVLYDPTHNLSLDEMQSAALLGSKQPIVAMHIDNEGNFWWIAEGRLFYRNTKSQTTRQLLEVSTEEPLWSMASRNGTFYLLSSDGRIRRFGYSPGEGPLPMREIASPTPNSDYLYYRILVDSQQQIWLSQGHRGVWRYREGHFTEFSSTMLNQKGLVCSLIEDSDGNIWIASDHGGITIWQGDNRPLIELRHNPSDNSSLASNSIYALYRDRSDNIWLGYSKKGASIWRGNHKAYAHRHLKSCREQQLGDDINAITEDREGNLWFGTDSNGLICLNTQTGEEQLFTTANSPLKSNVITSLHCDNEGRIWIGTFIGGLSCYNRGKITTYQHHEGENALSSDNIWDIDQTADGRIVIGTLGGGLQLLEPESGRFTTYKQQNSPLSNNYIIEITRSKGGGLYLATAYGMNYLDPESGLIKPVIQSEPLATGSIESAHCDQEGMVWILLEGEVWCYDPIENRVEAIPTPGLGAVQGLEQGADGSMWALADNGVCHLYRHKKNPEQGYISRLLRFPNSTFQFNQRSSCLRSDGSILAGLFDGYIHFSPALHELGCRTMPTLYFTQLTIHNNPIHIGERVGGRVVLEKALEHTQTLTLNYDENIFSIQFVALNFSSSFLPELCYRLKGFSEEWMAVDEEHSQLHFINLRPGKYHLELRAKSDEAGIHTPYAALDITIRRPWWASHWAIVSYIILLGGVLFGVNLVMRKRQRDRIEALERRIQSEQQHFADEMKMQFFTNISHDFRTPLTLILTPLEELMRAHPETRNNLLINTIHRNAQRLLTLVNQILDLRKLEVYGMQLNPTCGNLVDTLNEVVEAFRLHSEHAHIALKFHTDSPRVYRSYDRDKMIKIATNLLSNAFKYTPEQGHIEVRLNTRCPEELQLIFEDSGCGIPEKERRHIFDRFYQSEQRGERSGNGIGLHIVREFTLMHGGDIRVEENTPTGCRFTLNLPLARCEEPLNPSEQEPEAQQEAPRTVEPNEPGKATLLVVDDNSDFRRFLRSTLDEEYRVLTAADGREALEVIEREVIDLVISDVMMPIMDGVELCRRLKSEITTSHIPVILLTARAMQEDEYEGLESGADEYITKPFNISILKLRIEKFLEWKRRAHALFKREIEIAPEQITITSLDDKLLEAAIEAVTAEIGNPDFSVTELSERLHMHRTHLYKKLLSLTGKAPLEFIRAIRLKRAAQLLEAGQTYIAEVAYMVGFNSPKLFARHFREEFGCSPSEYQRKHAHKNEIS